MRFLFLLVPKVVMILEFIQKLVVVILLTLVMPLLLLLTVVLGLVMNNLLFEKDLIGC